MSDVLRPLRFVLIDRDGTLNELVRGGYVTTVESLRLLDGALDAIRLLHEAGLRVGIVTNQSCIGRGLVSADTVAYIHAHLVGEILAHGGLVQAIYCCPHSPADGCDCRKPAPGLILRAMHAAGVEPGETVVVGDAPSDREAARRAGTRYIQVHTGYGADQPRASDRQHAGVGRHAVDSSNDSETVGVSSIREAAVWILAQRT